MRPARRFRALAEHQSWRRPPRIAELEQEIEGQHRVEEADARRERGCPPWVVLGVKAVETRAVRAANCGTLS